MTKVKIDNELRARAKEAFDRRSKILSNQSYDVQFHMLNPFSLSRIELRALERVGRVKSVIRKSSDGSIRRVYMRPATFNEMKKQWGKEKVIKKMPPKEKTALKKRLVINIFKRIWLFIKKFIGG